MNWTKYWAEGAIFMGYKSAILVVDDVLASRRFYETVFGLAVESDHGIYNVGFLGGLALYRRELFRELSDLPCERVKGESAVLYFEYEDVSAVEARLLAFPGTELIHATREQPWGQLAFRARDPDGHFLEIGEDMAHCVRRMLAGGMSLASIAEKTGYTLEKTAALAGQSPLA